MVKDGKAKLTLQFYFEALPNGLPLDFSSDNKLPGPSWPMR